MSVDDTSVPFDRLPSRCKRKKLKTLGLLKGGAGFPDRLQGNKDEPIPFFKVKALEKSTISLTRLHADDTVSSSVAKQLGATIFPAGTIVFAKVGAALLLGRFRILGEPGCIDNNMMGLIPKESIVQSKFAWYALHLLDFPYLVNPGAVPSINGGQLGMERLPVPPLSEQSDVTEFLDIATANADTLIATYERLIELLEEKRLSLITQTVTKGLDASMPMKDSGIEWIGKIPETWQSRRIRFLANVKRGASPRPIEDPIFFEPPGLYAWTRISDVTSSGMFLTKTEDTLSNIGADLSVKLEPGSLIVSIAASVGKTVITAIRCCIHDGFVCLEKPKVDSRFLYYVFESGEPYRGLGKLGTQLNLNSETIGNIWMPVPPIGVDQIKIADFLDRETDKIAALVGKCLNAVDLLRERRLALITAAVTGQIDTTVYNKEAVPA